MLNQTAPFLYAIAGIPAAGKTSFRINAVAKGVLPAHAFVHDCDAVMEAIPEYQQQLAQEGTAAAFRKWEITARELAEQQLQNPIQLKRDIIYDRSCALPESYTLIKNLVEQHGYRLIMHVLMINADEAKKRAIHREKQHGRHLPESLIVERLQYLRDLWPKYLQLATEAFILDNNNFQQRIIAEYKHNKLLINDKHAYDNFLS